MTESITESELSKLLTKSTEAIRDYLLQHPGILYKGIPLVVIIWMVYPLLATAWAWLPWVWASYEIYKIIPSGTLSTIINILKDHKLTPECLFNITQT